MLALLIGFALTAPNLWAQDASKATTLPVVPVQGTAVDQSDRVDSPNQHAALSKTGTKLKDLPGSVQVIPRALLSEQGATMLRDAIYNASGINSGGQDSEGYYDHFLIRGLNAQIYSDGFSDGDELSGLSHSLNGVERVEILEGPGSALFGSGPPGGTINIVHYEPSSTLHYGGNLGGGSFALLPTASMSPAPPESTALNTASTAAFRNRTGFASWAATTMKSDRHSDGHGAITSPTLRWICARSTKRPTLTA